MENLDEFEGNPVEAGSANDFFEAMERDVNSAIMDDQSSNEETLQSTDGPPEVTRQESNEGPSSNEVDWEKRYKDSSREATRIAGELNRLKPFVPVLEAMEKDSGLVDTVRDYLENGGRPTANIKDKLGLDEDFVFDSDDAMSNPDSDSAKVFNAHVDTMVQKRLNDSMAQKAQSDKQAQLKTRMRGEAEEFMTKHNMSPEAFTEMIEASKSRKMDSEDLYYLMNKDKAQTNVADATKADIMTQMKNVRDIQPSVGNVNSPRSETSPDDQIFDMVNGSSTDLNELFG